MERREVLAILAGAAVAWPLAARAQQKAMPVIGFLSVASPDTHAPFAAAFRQGLNEIGYIEGQSVAIEYRWAEGHYERLTALVADLVARKVDLIAATSGVWELRKATSAIPIIFLTGTDPVRLGLVASFARPGGNLTGIGMITAELVPKRLELLAELVPQVKTIALLVQPNIASAEGVVLDVREAVRAKGLKLDVVNASSEEQIDAAFVSLARLGVGALLVASSAFFHSRREQLVTLAARGGLPAIYEWSEFVAVGGLISYGPSLTLVYRQLGSYAGKILSGARPADLPVQQPTKFELVINLKAAKALGLTVPQSLLARADEVIE